MKIQRIRALKNSSIRIPIFHLINLKSSLTMTIPERPSADHMAPGERPGE
jgi:hypothetical protein